MGNPFEEINETLSEIHSKLIDIEEKLSQKNIPENEERPFMDLNELSKMLRPWYTKGSLYHIISRQDFPSFKIGKKYFFKKSEILNWIQEHKVK